MKFELKLYGKTIATLESEKGMNPGEALMAMAHAIYDRLEGDDDKGCYNCSYCDGDDMRCTHPEHTTDEGLCECWDGENDGI